MPASNSRVTEPIITQALATPWQLMQKHLGHLPGAAEQVNPWAPDRSRKLVLPAAPEAPSYTPAGGWLIWDSQAAQATLSRCDQVPGPEASGSGNPFPAQAWEAKHEKSGTCVHLFSGFGHHSKGHDTHCLMGSSQQPTVVQTSQEEAKLLSPGL
jgi:hypothetical protein